MMKPKAVYTGLSVLILAVHLFLCGGMGLASTFVGEVATGLMELKDFKHPVHLYVPDSYQPAQPYPLLVILPGEGDDAAQVIQNWVNFAKRKSIILLVPGILLSRGLGTYDVPTNADTWLFRLKEEVGDRYRIAERRTFLIGEGTSAHYAGYLGMKYPAEFAGIGMLGGSWVGTFEKLAAPSTRAKNQIPFFVSLKSESLADEMQAAEVKALDLTEKGYPIHLEKLDAGEEFKSMEFRKRLFDWLVDKSSKWSEAVEQGNKTPKEKIGLWAKEFFKVN